MRRFARFARLAAALVAAVLVGGCTYLAEKQGELIFRPTKDEWRGFRTANAAVEDHWIPVGSSGDKLHAFWAAADKPDAPVLLYLHGARWNLTGSITRIDRWRRLGYHVLAIDYRGFGKSTDVSPSEQRSYEDAEAAWDWLAARAPDKPRYIVGHSLGGAIATELAVRRHDAAGVVLEATFTSIRDMIAHTAWSFLPVGLILDQEFDSLSKIARIRSPLLIVHGTRDAIVPYEMGERLYAAATAPKRFIRVEDGSHHNLSHVAFEEYRRVLAELFRSGGGGGRAAASPG
ncbi:MAG TPA: alpha/beta fold hydrolase [Usitatibacteraceae bacterium]|nr:alpha/beta fold hydrolase [Usitatibacteraceae bacterium]